MWTFGKILQSILIVKLSRQYYAHPCAKLITNCRIYGKTCGGFSTIERNIFRSFYLLIYHTYKRKHWRVSFDVLYIFTFSHSMLGIFPCWSFQRSVCRHSICRRSVCRHLVRRRLVFRRSVCRRSVIRRSVFRCSVGESGGLNEVNGLRISLVHPFSSHQLTVPAPSPCGHKNFNNISSALLVQPFFYLIKTKTLWKNE
jgi:hypothetical protein